MVNYTELSKTDKMQYYFHISSVASMIKSGYFPGMEERYKRFVNDCSMICFRGNKLSGQQIAYVNSILKRYVSDGVYAKIKFKYHAYLDIFLSGDTSGLPPYTLKFFIAHSKKEEHLDEQKKKSKESLEASKFKNDMDLLEIALVGEAYGAFA